MSCDVLACHAYRVGLQGIVYLVFLGGHIQYTHVCQRHFKVLVTDRVYQLLRDDAFFVQCTTHRVFYCAQ